ncbi:flippase [Thermococcus sp.]|uniref:flippase n=1 Tax=Thermococcus sp. TaxID=35749 RepID=UPI002611D7F8|nr:flippase [Thermococcus sp.]
MGSGITGELGKAARGGALALIGMVVSAVFGFLVRAVVGRTFGPDQYGSYNLAITVFTVTLVFVMLGFPAGLQRQVAYMLHRGEEKVSELIGTAVILVTTASILGVLVLELTKPLLPRYIGGGELLVDLLSVLALALPFTALFNVLISASQGFGRVREFVLYGKIGFPGLNFILVTVLILVLGRITAVPLAYLLTATIMLFLLVRSLVKAGILTPRPVFFPELARYLLLFSLPLMTSNLTYLILNWTDTLMLGHYLGEGTVGLYNAASPLARFIPVFLASLTVLYNPIATGFFARGELDKLGRFYSVITKWVVLLTFPLFLLLVAYPVPVLGTLFGGEYTGAWKPLVILSLGFAFNSLAGPTGLTLITMGMPGKNLKGDSLGAGLNVLLNYLLIPVYGMTGAALSTASSYIATNLYKLSVLLRSGINPFNGRYVRILLGGSVITLAMLPLRTDSLVIALLLVALGSLAFYLIALLGGAFEEEDLELLKLAGERFGINIEWIERLLSRFAR